MCIYATREGDYVLFHHEGGVDVGDVDAKAQKLLVGVDEKLNTEDIKRHLLVHAPEDKKELSSERERHGHKWGQEVQCETGDQCTGLWVQERESRVGLPAWEPRVGGGCGLAISVQYASLIPHLLAPVWLVPSLALSLTASFRLSV